MVTNLSVYSIAAYVFVPSFLGENIPTAEFGMIAQKLSAGQWWAKLLRLLTVNSLSYFVKIKY